MLFFILDSSLMVSQLVKIKTTEGDGVGGRQGRWENRPYAEIIHLPKWVRIASTIVPFIKPWRMREGATVVILCVSLCVCVSVTTLAAVYMSKMR